MAASSPPGRVSWVAVKVAYEIAVADPSAKLVLVTIAFRANSDGRAWPSIASLCRDTGLSDRAVRNAVRRLVKAKLLTVTHRPGLSLIFELSTGGADGCATAAPGAGTAAPGAGHRGTSKHGELVKEHVKERGGRAKHVSDCPCRGTGWLETWDPAAKALIAVACPDGPQP